MKIAYFAESLEENKDGVSRVIYKYDDYNRIKNIESLYITSVPSTTRDFNYIKTKSLPIPGYEGYRISISNWQKILEEVKFFKPDIIHLHAPFMIGRIAINIANALKIPCISTYHTHFITYLKYHNAEILVPVLLNELKTVYNSCDLNLIPSQNVLDELEELEIENMEVLNHGVDFKIFNPNYKNNNLKTKFDNKTLFLYVGRLVWEKNLKLMAKVFSKLYNERNNFELLIVGTGPAESGLKEILPQAKYLGFKTGSELSEIYASSDVFVFPSDTETFGNVTIEALASGLPCLVANGGGSADIIKHNYNGLRFKADSFEEFYTMTLNLLDDKILYCNLQKNAIESSHTFSWDVIHNNLIEHYKQQIFINNMKESNKNIINSKKDFYITQALVSR